MLKSFTRLFLDNSDTFPVSNKLLDFVVKLLRPLNDEHCFIVLFYLTLLPTPDKAKTIETFGTSSRKLCTYLFFSKILG